MKETIITFLVLALFPFSSLASEIPKTALVLSGGIATRGLSEIGVIKALEEEQIPINYVVGTSMGAVLGSLLAQGYTADEIEKIAKSIDWMQAFAQVQDYSNLIFGEKEKYGKYLLRLDLEGFKPIIPRSMVPPQKPSLLFTEVSVKALNIRDFDQFQIPFRANATDIETGEEVVFSSGYLPKALQASSAVPVMLAPVKIEGRLLVDGGAVNNLPVNVAREEFNPDLIIAVDLGMGLRGKEEINSFMAVLSQSLALSQEKITKKNRALADIVIEPDISAYGFADFSKIDEIIEIGYKAAKAKISEIKELIKEKGMVIPTREVVKREYAAIKKIAINGNTVFSDQILLKTIGSRSGDPFDAARVMQDQKKLWEKYYFDGYKLAEIRYSFDEMNRILSFDVREGGLEEIQILGLENVSEVFLMNKIHSGRIFNSKKAVQDADRIFATGLFESVDFTIAPGKKDWVLIYVLKEKRANSFALGIRYDTYQEISLLADFTLKYFQSQNLLQTLSLKVGSEHSYRLISEFWPRRLGKILFGEVTLFHDRKIQDLYSNGRLESTFYYMPKGLSLAAKINIDPLGQISAGLKVINTSYEKIFSLLPDENVSKLFVASEFDFLDNPLSPRRGISARAEYQHAGLYLGGEYEFAKALADVSIYFPLPREHVIFTKGHLQLGRGEVPLSEKYRLGGEANLLGYGRTQFVGKHAAAIRIGYRLPVYVPESSLISSVYLSFLQDFGVVASKIEDLNTENVNAGYGLELQAVTILGLSSRVSLGFGKTSRLFFAIGNEF